jgi:hypothetical protein
MRDALKGTEGTEEGGNKTDKRLELKGVTWW